MNDRIGSYQLIRKLGEGRFGEVWLAKDFIGSSQREFVIKLPLKSEIDLDALLQESATWMRVPAHPNVLEFIATRVFDGQIALVSEYAPDGSMKDWLGRSGGRASSVEASIEMTLGILSGIEHLHQRNVIHRDLKPDNVMLLGSTPRVTDFGVLRALKSIGDNGSGTPYLAPEAFNRNRNQQTDLWSVAVMLFQMLSGRLPFEGADPSALYDAICNEEPEPPPDAPGWLQDVIAKALIKVPDRRYQTAAEMSAALTARSTKIEEVYVSPPRQILEVDETSFRQTPDLTATVEVIPLLEKQYYAVASDEIQPQEEPNTAVRVDEIPLQLEPDSGVVITDIPQRYEPVTPIHFSEPSLQIETKNTNGALQSQFEQERMASVGAPSLRIAPDTPIPVGIPPLQPESENLIQVSAAPFQYEPENPIQVSATPFQYEPESPIQESAALFQHEPESRPAHAVSAPFQAERAGRVTASPQPFQHNAPVITQQAQRRQPLVVDYRQKPVSLSQQNKRRRVWLIGGATVLLVVIALAVYIITRSATSPAPAATSVAPRIAGQTFIENLNGVKLEMIGAPAGSFLMGSPDNESGRSSAEGPRHRVSVKAFSISKYEVTQALWKAVIDGRNPSRFKGDDLPVENVTWNESKEFCQKLSQMTGKVYSLPSEAEWEYASRSKTRGTYPSHLTGMAWFSGNARGKTQPVGKKLPNAFELHDMHGNVWEWCEDVWHKSYSGEDSAPPSDGSPWVTGGEPKFRALRGGSWNNDLMSVRSASRVRGSQAARGSHIGFRVVVSPRNQQK